MMKLMKMVVFRMVQLPRAGCNLFALLVIMVFSAVVLTGCESSQGSQIGTATSMEENAVVSGDMWPAFYDPNYFEHGYGPEDQDRRATIAAARAAGLNCIRADAPNPPTDEAAMHLLHFKSPVDGHLLDGSWYDIALASGISRYVINVGDGSSLARWKFLTKDYPANTIQWLVNGAVVAQ